MSHEMLTPVNAIIGMMQVAKISGSLDGIKDCLNEIGDASQQLVKLIKNVLDVSGEGSTITFVNEEFTFKKMLDYVINKINPDLINKNQMLTMDISQSIPENLFGDEKRIAQVIMHLLLNASKFTQENGKIHLDARKLGEDDKSVMLQFDIMDNGIGVSDEQRDKLFDIFEQMDDSITSKHGGIGVGLALSKLIVEMMNGKIWFESKTGEGSTFSFTCNVEKAEGLLNKEQPERTYKFLDNINGTGKIPNTHPDESANSSNKLYKKRILVVDDVTTNRKVVGSLLRQMGAEVIEAGDGRESVKVFAENAENIDLILMDVEMPEMDGYDATQQIRGLDISKAGSIPIIALLANADDEHSEAIASGMDFYLVKPIEPHILYSTLDRYLK